jgi:hypothetical protein
LEHAFRNGFVHGRCATANVAADVGQLQHFQQTLDGAVFARWSVECRKNNVGLSRNQLGCAVLI